MKKILSIIALIGLTFVVISCSSKPVDDEMGKAIIANSIEMGKAENIKCLDALTSEDIAKKAIEKAGGSLRGYAEWVQSESGQAILQEAMVKCMSN